MKAIVQDRYGPPALLRYTDVVRPEPGLAEVLVRMHAATVNAGDWHVVRGDPKLARLALPAVLGLRGPKKKILGTDFAGRVEAVGSAVTRLRPGDEVYGSARGAFAEYVCADQAAVGPKPANLTFEQAAALPLAATTALTGLRDLAQVRPGQHVLINGASGGVGLFAVQVGKVLGIHVTGVCSTRNLELVTEMGADAVIDYRRDDFARRGKRYDVVFDLAANRSLADLRRALAPAGVLILAGGGVYTGGSLVGPMRLLIAAMLVSPFASQRLLQLSAQPSYEHLAALRELAEAGNLTPIIERTYPLSRVPEAITHLETEHARAKIAITP